MAGIYNAAFEGYLFWFLKDGRADMVMTQAQAADTLRDLMNIVLDRKVKEALKIAVELLKKESGNASDKQT